MDAGFYVPVRIVGGEDCVKKGAQHFARFGQQALIVCGKSAASNGALDDVKEVLSVNGQRGIVYDAIPQNPTVASVMEGARIARENRVNFIIAIGGGSPMDAAKAIAMLACQDIPEGLFAHKIGNAVLPMIHIPTTAGTGSEVTPYAIITNDELQTKQSISSPALFPHIAFLDGKYMAHLPQDVTVNTAIDAISHAVEGMLSVRAGGMSDLFAKQALSLLMREYENLLAGSYTLADRQNLLYGSALAGMVIANTGTTPVHGMGYSLTYFHGVPHGRANGLLLPNFLKECEKIWMGSTRKVFDALGMDVQEFAQKLKALLGRHKKLSEAELRDYAARAAKNKNVRNCRVPFTEENLYTVLKRSVG